MSATFHHRNYSLVNDDKIVRNASAPPLTMVEESEILQEVARYVEAKIAANFGFVSIPIPGEDSHPSTSILASPDWTTARKLLMIIQNASGSHLGIFSRSICLEQGLKMGTMLPYIERAVAAGYGILILRPNTNSILEEVAGEKPKKILIPGSETPEVHALCVWENVVTKAENAQYIAMLAYGNGASLCKELLLRQMVRSKEDESEVNRIKSFVTIEASTIIEEDDAVDIKTFIKSLGVNMECNAAPRGYRLNYRKEKLGCNSVSLGLPAGATEVTNVAASVSLALEPVFTYLALAEQGGPVVSNSFVDAFAKQNGLSATTAVVMKNPDAEEEKAATPAAAAPPSPPPKLGFFARMFGSSSASSSSKSSSGSSKAKESDEEKLTVADFDLLKIVGKGAFGKVMLVKKKNGVGEGQIYAMKVLKKSVVAAKGQIEHTKSEREILCEIRHPFIVRLRFAFQSDDKLYLVTDYYNGGTLFYHLRKSRAFTEDRARYYAAELLSALDHLHQQHIIYRDLKLENVLMDHQGHVALTDFGLSKQDIDKSGGATTFCGTAEYIAPELLRGQKYGKAVDWWSFGILLFEMMHGRTPFYDKNRKLMFYRIINTEPSFPPTFSQEAADCIRGLLRVSEADRLGSSDAGAKDIMNCPFFAVINFDALNAKEIPPPFTPEVTDELDTKYVPKAYLQAEAKDSFSEPPKRGEANHNFEAFTFAGDSALN